MNSKEWTPADFAVKVKEPLCSAGPSKITPSGLTSYQGRGEVRHMHAQRPPYLEANGALDELKVGAPLGALDELVVKFDGLARLQLDLLGEDARKDQCHDGHHHGTQVEEMATGGAAAHHQKEGGSTTRIVSCVSDWRISLIG